jgi:hypothetical protein
LIVNVPTPVVSFTVILPAELISKRPLLVFNLSAVIVNPPIVALNASKSSTTKY